MFFILILVSFAVCFTKFGYTTTIGALNGSTLTLALGIMDMTGHSIVVHLLHTGEFGFGAFSSTKESFLNSIVIDKRRVSFLDILLVHLHFFLLAKHLDHLGDEFDGQLDVFHVSGCVKGSIYTLYRGCE